MSTNNPHKPNPKQRRAATHGDGPLLIVAGAGSGKTRTLAARVAHLVANGIPPERILLLTFSRQAAREMLARAVAAARMPRLAVWSGTFHAVAHRLLRLHADALGLAPGFTVLDRSDAEDLLDVEREALGLRSDAARGGGARFPRKATCLSIYSRCVNAEAPLDDVLARHYPWAAPSRDGLQALFRRYEERKLARSVLDLDDLLVWWQALQEDAQAGPRVAERFDHVLVDEYQDTNRVQRALLLALRRANRNLTVVGDDAQAIYGFRGATVRNMLDFERDFAGATVVRLERNYRSTAPILEATNQVIAQARERLDKTLRPAAPTPGAARPILARVRDEAAEAEHVVRVALARLEAGISLRQQAVLFRAAHHSDLLEVALARRKIPFRKFGGLRFVDAAHVKDVVAFLRVAQNPADEPAWFRVLQLLDGVGARTARRAFDHLAGGGYSLAALAGFKPPAAARDAWAALVELLGALRPGDPAATPGPAEALERVRAFYEPLLRARYDHVPSRLGDLDALARLAQGAASRGDLLADLALDPPAGTGDLAGPSRLDEDWLVLSTIHSAKGLEWDAVTLLRGVDGAIPSDLATGDAEDVEEELRLFYVALTRARRHLTVIAPLRFHVPERRMRDVHVWAPLTRFLPPDVLRHFDQEVGPGAAPSAPGAAPAGPSAAAGAVRARVIGRWSS